MMIGLQMVRHQNTGVKFMFEGSISVFTSPWNALSEASGFQFRPLPPPHLQVHTHDSASQQVLSLEEEAAAGFGALFRLSDTVWHAVGLRSSV